jgi:Protein of unknown function (DUF3099)
MSRSSRTPVHLVTQARPAKSADIGSRERRYLIMMTIRVACFLAAIVMVSKGLGWFAAFPAVGAVVIPYFAVVFANGGREPTDTSGFREYEPRLPEHRPPAAAPPVRAHLADIVIPPAGGDRPASPPGPGGQPDPAGQPGPARQPQTDQAAAGHAGGANPPPA